MPVQSTHFTIFHLPMSFPLMSCGTPSFIPCHVSVSREMVDLSISFLFLSMSFYSFPNLHKRHTGMKINGNLRPSFLRAGHVCSLTSFRAVQRTQRACHLQMSLATSWMIPGQTIVWNVSRFRYTLEALGSWNALQASYSPSSLVPIPFFDSCCSYTWCG